MQTLLHSVPPVLQLATTDPCLCWRLLDTHRHVWVSLLWGHCSFLLGPGGQGSVCAHHESFSQSCVSSGSSLIGLLATSSKRAYATPKSAAPRAPAPVGKARGDDGIPVELFQILKDAAVKPLHSICQQIWKTQQWPLEKVSFHSNPKERQFQRMLKLLHNCTHLTR